MAVEPVIPEYSEVEGYRFAVFARSGHGKSYLARWIVEKLLDKNWQVLVIEPVAEWETLREVYEVLVFGGEAGDLPAVPAAVVEALASGASAIVNLEGERLTAIREKAQQLLDALYRRWQQIRRPLLLVLEEAQVYAPQRFSKSVMPLLEIIDLVAKTGRKIGINLLLISQRPASVSKDVVSQSNILFLGAFSDPRDVKAAREYAAALGVSVSAEELAKLSKGEFLEIIVGGRKLHVHAPTTKTRHAGATPGLRAPPPPPSMSELIERLRGLAEEEHEDTVTLPRREYEELKKRLKELEEENRRLRRLVDEYRLKLETVEIVARKLSAPESPPPTPTAVELALPEPERRILEALEREPTHELPFYKLAEAARLKTGSKRFMTALKRLQHLGLIVYDKKARKARLAKR